MTETVNLPQIEQPSQQTTFEHLFPGARWNELNTFDPLAIPYMLDHLTRVGPTEDARFGDAVSAGKGYAARVHLLGPDKLSLSYFLMGAKKSDFKPRTGELIDLLEDGEVVRGVAEKSPSWLKKEAQNTVSTSAYLRNGESPFDQAQQYIIGVSKDNIPTGLIFFRPGARPLKGHRLPTVIKANLSVQQVGI